MRFIHKNLLHLEPECGLMNDPNGLAYFDGKYYVFYQWNRFKLDHSYKEWGLFTSIDLLHWTNKHSAILPDSPWDKDGIYSGSAIVKDNKLHLFFTGNVKNKDKRKSYQRHAIMYGTNKFIKQDMKIESPVGFTEHFRDPSLIKVGDKYKMIVGGQTEDYHGAIAIFDSQDLNSWKYQGIFYENEKLDQMCECPNWVRINKQDLLILSPQRREISTDKDISSYSAYLIGNEANNQFIAQSELTKLDDGFDFYAPQVFQDDQGRTILYAWMSRMSQQQEQTCPTRKQGYIHCLTLGRELSIKNGHLLQKPLREYRLNSEISSNFQGKMTEFCADSSFEIYELYFNDVQTDFEVKVANNNVNLNFKDGWLQLNRLNWANKKYQTKKIKLNRIETISFYVDHSAMEIFINNGEHIMSMRYFCDDWQRVNVIQANKNFKLEVRKVRI